MSRSKRALRLLVFDWDGTLLDSVASIVDCTQETLRRLRLPPAGDSVIRGAIGLGLRDTVERFAPGCDDETYRRIVAVYRQLWFGIYSHQPRLFGGVREMLSVLRERGYLLAVATAKSRSGLDRDLAAAALVAAFDATRTVDEARSKPHPQMILDIVDELGTSPQSTLVVGDSIHDLQMAHNAGAYAAGVCTGAQSREGLERASPLVCFENLGQLPQWLDHETLVLKGR